MKAGTYMISGMDGYELCHPTSQENFEKINTLLNGALRLPSWEPIEFQLISEDEGSKLKESDSPWLGSHALIFRKYSIRPIMTFLLKYGELLPLSCSEVELLIFNPAVVLDALNETESSVTRFNDQRIMMINSYVFKKDVIKGIDIFKIPSLKISPTFVSEKFVEKWKLAGLKGLEYTRVD